MTYSKNTVTREDKRPSNAVLQANVFTPYIKELADLLEACKAGKVGEKRAEIAAALDGQPGRELRKLYSSDALRDTGTYFTGSNLANQLVSSRLKNVPRGCRIVDPACGAGDLLVACARHLPMKPELIETLVEWGKVLVGFDINPAFVEATRYRLALLAIQRISSSANRLIPSLPLPELFPLVQARSAMEEWQLSIPPSLIVVNPPFSYGATPNGCVWASGRVSNAALFMDACLNNGSEGAQVLAILPDVLRTGTRYRRWRQIVAQNATVISVEIAGQFDAQTDISVFMLELEISRTGSQRKVDWACPLQTGERTLKDVFEIRVGPVVPFRLDGTGPWSPFAQLEDLPPWGTVESMKRHIRFRGTTYDPPFVAIRRTSKANYQFRCIGTVVAGKSPTAVENHLLVALPYDKKVSTCKKLLALLKTDAVTNWMNERIRCRHLTVGSVGDLPWRETE